jgi:hypothetical protein
MKKFFARAIFAGVLLATSSYACQVLHEKKAAALFQRELPVVAPVFAPKYLSLDSLVGDAYAPLDSAKKATGVRKDQVLITGFLSSVHTEVNVSGVLVRDYFHKTLGYDVLLLHPDNPAIFDSVAVHAKDKKLVISFGISPEIFLRDVDFPYIAENLWRKKDDSFVLITSGLPKKVMYDVQTIVSICDKLEQVGLDYTLESFPGYGACNLLTYEMINNSFNLKQGIPARVDAEMYFFHISDTRSDASYVAGLSRLVRSFHE